MLVGPRSKDLQSFLRYEHILWEINNEEKTKMSQIYLHVRLNICCRCMMFLLSYLSLFRRSFGAGFYHKPGVNMLWLKMFITILLKVEIININWFELPYSKVDNRVTGSQHG